MKIILMECCVICVYTIISVWLNKKKHRRRREEKYNKKKTARLHKQ